MGRVIPGQFEIPTDHLLRMIEGRVPERPVVLVVDDLPENLFALEQLLSRDDVEVVTAHSGREALEVLLARNVAVALVDVQMPEMDGFELARFMRGVGRTRHVPIIFVTAGSHDPQRIFLGYQAGAVDFLFKPLDVHVLRGKVDVFVAMDRQRRALETSEARFRRLYDLGWIGVIFTDRDRRVIEANDAFLDMLGYSRADLAAGMLYTNSLTPERYSTLDDLAIGQLWSLGRYEVFKKEFRHKQGHLVPVLIGGSVADAHGVAVSFVLDMTEHQEAERMRELFVAMLGHDLRNPLGAAMAGAQVAMARTAEESVQKPLRTVLSAGTRMLRLIDQILEMTRLHRHGPIAIRPVETELRGLVEEVLRGAPAPQERIRVEAVGDTTGRWDPDRIFQVLSNLVGNACEHGVPGEPILVRIDGSRSHDVEVQVRNSGPPIPEALRRVIFEPFRASGDRPARGLGLGLYISKQFVLAHGGRIEVLSAEGEGTSFAVRLPRFTA